MQKKHATMIKGFSLIELTTVVFIISLIIGMGLDIATDATTANRIRTTQEKMEAIEKALLQYLQANTWLPCPADPDNINSDPLYASIITEGQCFRLGNSGVSSTYAVGILPTRDMGLSDSYLVDGWGRNFTYIVNTQSTSDGGFAALKKSGDYIKIQRETSTGTETFASNIVYAVISHGQNGYGAYLPVGGGAKLPNDLDEVSNAEFENSDDDNVLTLQVDRSDANNESFDDIIAYKTKSQLLLDTGSINDYQLCSDIVNIAKSPGPIANGVTTCLDPSTNRYETTCHAISRLLFRQCLHMDPTDPNNSDSDSVY